VTDDQMTVDCN